MQHNRVLHFPIIIWKEWSCLPRACRGLFSWRNPAPHFSGGYTHLEGCPEVWRCYEREEEMRGKEETKRGEKAKWKTHFYVRKGWWGPCLSRSPAPRTFWPRYAPCCLMVLNCFILFKINLCLFIFKDSSQSHRITWSSSHKKKPGRDFSIENNLGPGKKNWNQSLFFNRAGKNWRANCFAMGHRYQRNRHTTGNKIHMMQGKCCKM